MKKIGIILGVLVLLAVVWWLASPLFLDRTVDEALPVDGVVVSEDGDTEANKNLFDQPSLLRLGVFAGTDAVHRGSGEAQVYVLPDASRLLRFEEFSVTNGPDLRVLLTADGDARDSIDLGALKGNLGDQNYEIGSDVDLDRYNTAMIYCRAFHVVFATAKLGAFELE